MKYQVSGSNLVFREFNIEDPVPTGQQLLENAGYDASASVLLAVLPNGDFEDVRLRETFDLRGRGVERFVVFGSDRLFRFFLGTRQILWGEGRIRGEVLYRLADAADMGVFLDVPGGTDRLIDPSETVDLTAPGVERFILAPRALEIIVNARPHRITNPVVTYLQIVALAFPGPHDGNTSFSVTYRLAVAPPAGEMGPGDEVKVKNGSVFNVTKTIKS
ncbi:MAG: multiubiquitin domain-containing protein [Deltaproteobacteria bacterium]|nr:multiubiquitin domain-containing protein [Deltaproteobacteria bacterium]